MENLEVKNLNLKSINTGDNILKIIAIICMVIDHVGNNFYPEIIGLRIIGRLVIPIFSYLIAKGIYRTRNPRKYCERILIFGALAQIPYVLYFNVTNLNIMFTFLIAVIFLYGIRDKKYNYSALAIILLLLLSVEGGFFVFSFPLAFYYFRDRQITAFLTIAAIVLFRFMLYDSYISLFYLLGVGLVFVFEKINFNFELKLPKYFIYAFYPAHLIVLYFIYTLK